MSAGLSRLRTLLLGLAALSCTKVRDPDPIPVTAARKAVPKAAPSTTFDSTFSFRRPVDAGDNPDTAPDAKPRLLDRDAIQRVVNAAMPALSGCLVGGSAGSSVVQVDFDAAPVGRPQNVKVKGASTSEACVRGVILALSFPKFDGKAEPMSFPIPIYQPPKPSPSPGVAANPSPPPGEPPSPSPTPAVPVTVPKPIFGEPLPPPPPVKFEQPNPTGPQSVNPNEPAPNPSEPPMFVNP